MFLPLIAKMIGFDGVLEKLEETITDYKSDPSEENRSRLASVSGLLFMASETEGKSLEDLQKDDEKRASALSFLKTLESN